MTTPTDTRTPPSNDPAPLVAGTDVTKSFRVGSRSVEVLHGVSLAVRPGEMCAVMGPSGSGKSTLLHTLAGLEPATSGAVSLVGRPVAGLSRAGLARLRRTDVGFVFQSYNLLPFLSAFENVALPFRLRGENSPRREILDSLATVGLASLVDARPSSMSGGEQQRVALSRVLAQRPRVVFADEPTGALDTHSGRVVLAELRRVAHHPDRCVLTVTHDPVVAAACDRVLVLSDGYLVRELVRPAAAEVADLITRLGAERAGAPA